MNEMLPLLIIGLALLFHAPWAYVLWRHPLDPEGEPDAR